MAAGCGLTRVVAGHAPDLPVQAMGLGFRNPVGLAAGMDKNAAHIDALGSFGFGHIEAGTVTPLPQPGNPKPRLFRLVPAEGLINRMGFNNDGVERFVANVRAQKRFRTAGGVLGLNIGKNAATPIERALDDYVAGLRAVYLDADYIAVNISSPNTKDLRALQGERELGGLLRGLRDERRRLEDRHGRRVPLAVKIAPDLGNDAIPPLADTLVAHDVDGVIATNTTIARDSVHGLVHAEETGGLSGRPLARARHRSRWTARRAFEGSAPDHRGWRHHGRPRRRREDPRRSIARTDLHRLHLQRPRTRSPLCRGYARGRRAKPRGSPASHPARCVTRCGASLPPGPRTKRDWRWSG